MKTNVREMTDGELLKRLDEAQKELLDMRFKAATRQLKSPSDISKIKKEIARLRTIKRERELGV
ncbi:MAG: 50S ribosomal protein L29 [Dehalococcoidales bacterium]|mgnify:CR=1 FL=1|jgi:large subunit ribosomal protein L29|nr:50S ribosomal protein L29 [Dehalococcoidales bacterium]MDD3264470.1 50S ribosomal protein L29 [Dehalococcoidales bacterium]MDD4322001.1 50S ribosomal protein L29 [Dehalococcoidales bacterium]MDD4793906.1 50S ribosomal protein L29 [Dehalococcoidales bacterium]MDD5122088.1 50S ribosomal protein L29 [Dehalococcoidales bacterium]